MDSSITLNINDKAVQVTADPAMRLLWQVGDAAQSELGIALNGWIKITADGSAVLAMPRSEMGQGVQCLPVSTNRACRLWHPQ